MLKYPFINSLSLLAFIVLIILDIIWGIGWWTYILLATVWTTLTIIGSFHIRWNYHLPALHFNHKIPDNLVSITFDDGPHPNYTPKVLELLQKYNARATFFCVGHQVKLYGGIAKQIVDNGHTIGNHTYTHANKFGFFGTQKVLLELQKTKAIIKEKTGVNPQLYRPAFGVTNPSIKRAVKKMELKTVGWNIRSLDTTKRSKKAVLKRITSTIQKGDIILLHDSSEKTVEVLEQLLLFLQQNKMQSVTVDQLLDIEAYA
ncbi:polysaccharide deacetylase family protein [Arenibacter sp. M-2]|uniref:polysaccharide deacetylase family protein n=1 Tax=unclassified Arenibacter TaxID=2615047 RepID=UPI000D76BCA6|nr:MULTISPECIES: polysaccharide deacetylase family protein [unclassified Arenibacter]MDL5511369.1 polysaccharide deacetylase family protein [Arenibacter sp. M-2]PXX29175.1 peptidoglycan/xylan/chitin deacetylase (PgdA/CDA1 family) [Arenibacter sp. ARW7G5Y1]|tara:strand:- start:9843 stop:10619 length:777 start_codon:yes stop_codon:yes gene_type:complete